MIKRISDLVRKREEEKKSQKPIEVELKELRRENEVLKKEFRIQAFDIFKSRRSVRKFSTKDIEWKVISQIIEAALNHPCAGGIENGEIIVVQDNKSKSEIGKIENQQFWLADAPYLLVVVRESDRLMDLYPGEGELYGVQNVAALVENILMLAHCYGLGACWVESCENRVLKEFLGVPEGKHVDAVIPIGFPLEIPEVSRSHFFTKVSFEKYGNRKK